MRELLKEPAASIIYAATVRSCQRAKHSNSRASATDAYNSTTLSIPALSGGSSTLSNVVIIPAAIVSVAGARRE